VHEGGKGLLTARASDPNLLRVLEGAVRLGSPLLLEEVPEGGLPPGLEGLLVPLPQQQRQQEQRTGRWWHTGLADTCVRLIRAPLGNRRVRAPEQPWQASTHLAKQCFAAAAACFTELPVTQSANCALVAASTTSLSLLLLLLLLLQSPRSCDSAPGWVQC
jgi:hypothetical protein